jgi:hypothetical protein
MEKYIKKIGEYTIVADNAPQIKEYTNPEGKTLKKEDIWKDDVFYEQDYFQIEIMKNLHVVDETGRVCTPIIKELEVKNSGYVCTWNTVFWIQGFAILENKIFFVKRGEAGTYYQINPAFSKIKPGNENKTVDFNEFLNTMIEVTESLDYDNLESQMLL